MDRRLKSTLTAMNHFSVFTMVSAFTTVATGLIGLSAISVAKADEVALGRTRPARNLDRRI